MSSDLQISGFTPLTSIDYPDELAAVVFCQGCPWRCRYCHNRELLAARAEHRIPWDQIKMFLRRRLGLLDAVVFSGGEPTLQKALPEALREAQAMGYKTGLHTAGIYPEVLHASLPVLEWVGLDIKSTETDYPVVTGVRGSGAAAWKSAHLLIESGTAHEIRITLHPGLVSRECFVKTVDRLRRLGTEDIVAQVCRTGDTLDPGLAPLTTADIERCRAWAAETGTSLRE